MKPALVVALGLTLVLALAACKKAVAPPPPPPSQPSGTAPAGSGRPGDDGTVVQSRIGGDPAAARNALAVTIEVVHDNQQPTNSAPWYGPGGKWTYLDLKTPGGATFAVGFVATRTLQGDLPITMYDVRVQATDEAQGAAVVEELARALKTPVPPKPAVEKTPPLAPLTMTASQLGGERARRDDGSFSGTGSWKATKWTSERAGHSAELFFNYSLADMKAELAEKDGDYDADIVADLALALRDGGAASK